MLCPDGTEGDAAYNHFLRFAIASYIGCTRELLGGGSATDRCAIFEAVAQRFVQQRLNGAEHVAAIRKVFPGLGDRTHPGSTVRTGVCVVLGIDCTPAATTQPPPIPTKLGCADKTAECAGYISAHPGLCATNPQALEMCELSCKVCVPPASPTGTTARPASLATTDGAGGPTSGVAPASSSSASTAATTAASTTASEVGSMTGTGTAPVGPDDHGQHDR